MAFRELFNNIYDTSSQLGLAYLREGPRQRETLGRGEKVVGMVVILMAPFGMRSWYFFEEKRYWCLENIRYLLQSARTDAIGTPFILLELLK